MKRSSMMFYLAASVLIHAGMVLLLRNYRLAEMTAPEKAVQVEVAAIRELPMVSMEPTPPPPAAESIRLPPVEVAGAGLEAGKVKPPEFLSALSSPILDFHAGMDAVSPSQERFPETSSNRPVAATGARSRKSDSVKRPAPLSPSLSPSVDFSYAMAAISIPKRDSPVTVPSLPIVDIPESVAPPSTVEPVEFERPVIVEIERTHGGLKTASSGRRKVDAQSTAPAPLTYAWSFEASPLDSAVSSLSPRTPVILPPSDDPVLYEPPVRPPEFYFPGSERGAAFLLLVDTSGSVRGDPLEGIQRSARAFVGLMGEKDRAAVMTFDDKVSSFIGFTSETELLQSKIDTLKARGQRTLLFDGLLEAAASIGREDRSRRHIFLFSDGKDEGSRAGRDEVLRALAESNISVFAVGFTRVERQYLDVLRQFAEKTGGIFVQTPEFREMLALYKSTGPAPETISTDEETIVYLMVTSDPPDARIVINGKVRGNTPLTLSVPAGKHEIRIDKEGFYAWEAQLNLEQGRKRISASLVSKDDR